MDSGSWQAMLEGYGQQVTLKGPEGERGLKAFFQPVREKSPGQVPTPIGVAPAGKWLYLGPPQEELEGVEELLWSGRAFRPLRYRGIPVGKETFYQWALFEEQDEVRQ